MCNYWKSFFKKIGQTAVPEDGNPPRALVVTKLVEWYRFEVGHKKVFFVTIIFNFVAFFFANKKYVC